MASIADAAVEGLQGATYLDSLKDRVECKEEAARVAFAGEVDRIYLGTPDALRVVGTGAGAVHLRKTGLPDAVVWNPWTAKAARMGDFGDEEYRRMLCVEAGAVRPAVELGPGAVWTAQQVLSAGSS